MRSCLTCTTRLSELCYDTHTIARNVAVRYVVMIRFAMNAVHGLRIFADGI